MSTYLTTGFVLRVQPWRENDRLYTLLTHMHGKVDVIAAGTKKSNSKLSPHLQPFAEVELMVARGKRIDRLAAARLVQSYLKPPYALHTLMVGAALLEIARMFASEGAHEPLLSDLLKTYLAKLPELTAQAEWKPGARSLVACYLAEVFRVSGLAVPLTTCDVCHGQLTQPFAFSWQRHGFLHVGHAEPGEVTVSIAPEVVTWLRQAVVGQPPAAEMPPRTLAFLTDYAQAQLGKELSTLRVLRSTIGS